MTVLLENPSCRPISTEFFCALLEVFNFLAWGCKFLSFSTAGPRVRAETVMKISPSMGSLLETARSNPTSHQALMLKPYHKNHLLFFTGSKENSQKPVQHLIQLLPFQLLGFHLRLSQMQVTNFHLLQRTAFWDDTADRRCRDSLWHHLATS